MSKLGLAFEVEHVQPPLSQWHVIIRCVGTLPDNFVVQSGMLPLYYTRCWLNDSAVMSCLALDDSVRDRFDKPRVDMVGVAFKDAEDCEKFSIGDRVSLFSDIDPAIPFID